jgi:hypothetical protein
MPKPPPDDVTKAKELISSLMSNIFMKQKADDITKKALDQK